MILIMGGAGYIGSHTLRHLLDCGYECAVADNLVYGHREAVDPRAAFEKADLLDKDSLRNVFQKFRPEAVVHFAAFAYVGESVRDPRKYYRNNVAGTLNLLDVMREYSVDKIVFSSTCATYGEPQYLPIDEKHPLRPINFYGFTKYDIEKYMEWFGRLKNFRYLALRYFNAVGYDAEGSIRGREVGSQNLLPIIMDTAAGRREKLMVFGTDYDTRDGTCIRDYIHVEDLAAAHRLALEKLGKYNGCVNLGTGIGSSVREIITAAEKVSGWRCPVEYAPRRPGDPAKLFADNRKAGEILGWRPRYTAIEEIIETAWKWETNRKY